MRPCHRYLLEVIDGTPSPEASAWAVAGVRQWWHLAGTLDIHRCLKIGTPKKAVDAIRNDLLRQAAVHIEGGPTRRAEQLAKMCNDMEARLWPLWMDEQHPPARAGAVNALLWKCKRLGATLPASVRQIFEILCGDCPE
jgi:hypothetical protein